MQTEESRMDTAESRSKMRQGLEVWGACLPPRLPVWGLFQARRETKVGKWPGSGLQKGCGAGKGWQPVVGVTAGAGGG